MVVSGGGGGAGWQGRGESGSVSHVFSTALSGPGQFQKSRYTRDSIGISDYGYQWTSSNMRRRFAVPMSRLGIGLGELLLTEALKEEDEDVMNRNILNA
jgi:hypothetical protein